MKHKTKAIPCPTTEGGLRLLTIDELAERLHMSIWSVYKLVRDRRIPCVRLTKRGKILFDEKRVHAALIAMETPVK